VAAAATDLVRRAVPEGDLGIRRVVDLRYIGQGTSRAGAARRYRRTRTRACGQFETLYGSITA
jgi:hypothetical protein